MSNYIYTVYKITNKVNNRIYVGVHKTKNINDNYMGSGKLINYALKKHGKDKFNKEILFQFDNSYEAYAEESEIVSRRFLKRKDVYNITIGGRGGTLNNKNTITIIDKNNISKRIYENDLKYYIDNGWILGRSWKHTDESIIKNSIQSKGRKWINNGIKCKFIKGTELNQYLKNNWKLGRSLH